MADSPLDIILRTKKTGTGAKDAARELDDVSKTASKLGQIAGGLLKTGLTAAAGAAVKAVTDTANYNREVRQLSQSINQTTEETSRLVQVADDFGVSQDGLTRSLQMAAKNGFEPTIENIARLADETRAMADPTEKAAALSKVFGRNWAELVPLLSAGGSAIRENAAGISESLIVTKKASDATRAFEIAQDNLGDAVTALANEFGNIAIPVVTDFFNLLKEGVETADLLIHWQDRLVKVQQQHEAAVRTSARTYGEYISEVVRANGASEEQALILRDVERGLMDEAEGARLVAEASGAMTEAQFNASRGAYGVAGALDESNRAAMRSAEAAKIAAEANNEEASSFDKAAFAAELHAQSIEQNAKIAADNQAAIVSYADTVGTLAQKLKDATDAQAKQELAQAGINALKEARDEGTLSNEEYNTSLNSLLITYGLATEKSIAMGEGQAILNQLLDVGAISGDTYVASIANIPTAASDGEIALDELVSGGIDPAKLALIDASTATGELKAALDNLPRKIKIEIALEQTGSVPDLPSPGRAGGGPVAANRAFNVNEIFGERFVPYQSGSMMPAGDNYSTNISKGAIVIQAAPGMDINALASAVSQRLARQTRSARAMRGNG